MHGHPQFLIPTSSSTSPSYVSCVSRGVTRSALRSRIISASILSEGARSVSGVWAVLDACGELRVKSWARR